MIRQGASETREKAGQLKDTAETLTANVVDTANRMRQLESEASEDQGLTKEVTYLTHKPAREILTFPLCLLSQALEKANQAKSISSESSMKVREAISAVNDILLALNNMGSIGNLIAHPCFNFQVTL
jgi:hypothetical protein